MDIEETNRVRASLGLPLLAVPNSGPQFKSPKGDESSSEEEEQGSTLESRQAQGYDNWKKLQNDADAKVQREANREKFKKARDAAQKYSKLEGKGLGEADDAGEVDTKTWLKQQNKRRKKLEKAAKIEKELAERDNAPEYTAEDLAGVKVAHEFNDFEGGEEQILTLKDATIDQYEEEGDELENAELREREVLNDRLAVKKKKPVYDPNAEEEGGSILKHYDEAIDGKKRKRFTLEGQGASMEEREAMKQTVGEKLKAKPISLDIIKDDTPATDYMELSEVKMKKAKKNKSKSSRQKAIDGDGLLLPEQTNGAQTNGDSMDLDGANDTIQPKARAYADTSLVDDEDLQASLAIQRRAALKKRKKTKPSDIAQQLREEAATPDAEDTKAEEGGLIIDETTEFVANLDRNRQEERSRKELEAARKPKAPTPHHATASPTNEQDEDNDTPMSNTYESLISAQVSRSPSAAPSAPHTGLEEEATLTQGLGSTLNLLAQRGLVKSHIKQDPNDKDVDINALHRARDHFLTEKQKREAHVEARARAQRDRDRQSGKLDRMSAREREDYARQENKNRDQLESRQMNDIFAKEYKPDVQLKYTDEFGRAMSQKEAFKHLSHQFHGKGSGKQKTEKHLKKIGEERKREAQSSLDSSQATGMNNAAGVSAKRNRQAGVRLA